MGYYIDITLLPDPEFPDSLLMNALFAKLHKALVETGHGEVGVSFPKAQKKLGEMLRLHGSRSTLQRLMGLNWQRGLTDYISISSIASIPSNCQYRVVRRVQAKSSAERLYRRSVKKGWLAIEEAEEKISGSKDQYLKLPFVQLKSCSTGQAFRLFIQQGKLLDTSQEGKFSSYGLSDNATVPWF
jgi:CRISPR-associated endonuclease Csy4